MVSLPTHGLQVNPEVYVCMIPVLHGREFEGQRKGVFPLEKEDEPMLNSAGHTG
jgi:hypothetical protein